MRQLNRADRIRIRKTIHEWLPTRVSPGNNPTQEIDRLCPTCNRYEETPAHLLQCESPTRHTHLQKLREQLTSLCMKHAMDPHWYQMWWFGLTKSDAHTIDMYPPAFHLSFQTQSRLGWKQLYYGRFSKQWRNHLIKHQPHLGPARILTKTLSIIWNYVLSVWLSRNSDQHASTDHFPLNMESDLNGIYAAKDRLPQHTQERIFTLTKDELLAKPKQYILNWIRHTKHYIRAELKIIAKQQRTNNQDIRLFFPPR